MFYNFLFSCMIGLFCSQSADAINLTTTAKDKNNYELTVYFDANQQNYIYDDYFDFHITEPKAKITQWKPSIESISYYDPEEFKKSKKIFNKPFEITINVTSPVELNGAHLLTTYYPHSKKNTVQEKTLILHAPFITETQNNSSVKESTDPAPQKQPTRSAPWYSRLADALQTSDSFALQLLLAFLLGLLLSLTPCIYPMIPITIGILQVQGSKNIWYNFSLALCYTLGIATTFALLGLAAAFTGHLFGNLMNNPWFIIAIVIILAYFAGAMIGFYDMYIPRFFQPKNNQMRKGSFISAFIFGAVSGTVASPCLSPGLVLLLTMVSTLSNVFLGFALLFFFGIGLSIPLLIIGTFSSSLSVLPRAGMWMVEIKQLLGFVMLGVCFYFLRTIIPWHVLLWMITLFIALTGVYYLYQAKKSHAQHLSFKNIIGISLIAASVVVAYKAIQTTWWPAAEQKGYWLTDYIQACAIARQEKKPLLLELSTPFCSICSAIDRKIFSHKIVSESIQQFCVPVKIADFDPANPLHEQLKTRFNIMGVPACCIIHPEDEQLCKFWGPELYDMTPAEFMQQLSEFSCKMKFQ